MANFVTPPKTNMEPENLTLTTKNRPFRAEIWYPRRIQDPILGEPVNQTNLRPFMSCSQLMFNGSKLPSVYNSECEGPSLRVQYIHYVYFNVYIAYIIYTIFTLQATNISPQNGILKMIFLFPRWDMLIPWRVYIINTLFTRYTHILLLFLV